MWEEDVKKEQVGQERRGEKRQGKEESDNERRRRESLKLLGKAQIHRSVEVLKSPGVADIRDFEVRRQMEGKHPRRQWEIQVDVEKSSPVDNLRGLRDSLLSLKRGGSPGTGGMRSEFLCVLGEVLDGEKMLLWEELGMRYLQGKLPAWFQAVFLSSQSVALWKTEEQEAVRPIGVRHSEVRVWHREVVQQNRAEFLSYLEPVQLALSRAGCGKCVFSVRTLLEENPGFVVLKLDVKNAQNAISRAKIVSELLLVPQLRHLAWHAATVLAPYTALHTAGERWGEAQEGETQGDPEATPFFCVAWHRHILAADSILKAGGGMARFISDDGYLVGPLDLVLEAFTMLEQDILENCGLELQPSKCELYKEGGVLPEDCSAGLSRAGALVNNTFEAGFLCVGVPVGSDNYVMGMLNKKVDDVENEVRKVQQILGGERQAVWTILRASTQHKFDYWLGTVHPSLMVEAAGRMDGLLLQMLETCTGSQIPQSAAGPDLGLPGYQPTLLDVPVPGLQGQSFQWWVAQLPVKSGGLGLRLQSRLSPIAYLAIVSLL